MRTSSSRPSFLSGSRVATALALASAVAGVVTLAASCGGGGSQTNPPLPRVVIDVNDDYLDVGERYFLDGGQSTDPNGDSADLQYLWLLVSGGDDATAFDDHCRDNYEEICTSNDDDHCKNDTAQICKTDADCDNSTCQLNSGSSSSECSTGICGLKEGATGVKASILANVTGPYEVRLTAIGSKSNGTKTRRLNTYPSLYLVGSLIQFGGTKGALLGPVADAAEYAAGATQGVADPLTGDLLILDGDLGLIRVFDIKSGKVIGDFGESDRFLTDPRAMTFNPANGRLLVAQADGNVLMFDGTTGLLVSTFGNVGPGAKAMHFSPETGDLVVAYGGAGLRSFDASGNALGVLGETGTETTQAVDFDFLGESNDLVIADKTGRVVRCDFDGENCRKFSTQADNLLDSGSPSAIAVNPSADATTNDVMIADPVGERVLACTEDGSSCSTFGDTDEQDSEYNDVFFAPSETPTTTTSTSTTTTTTLK